MEQELIDRIEAYFKGTLSSAEKERLEADVENDPQLKALFNEYGLAMDAIDQQVEQEMRNQFREWGSEKAETAGKTRTIALPGIWKYAASLAIILGISYTFFIRDVEERSWREIALAEYEIPKLSGRTMGKSDELWSDGIEKYHEGDYAAAIGYWYKIDDPTDEMQYYTAHAYFNADSLEQATQLFEQLSSTNNNYSAGANWNLLLTYLAKGDTINFRNQVERMTASKNDAYKKEVQKLAKKLKY